MEVVKEEHLDDPFCDWKHNVAGASAYASKKTTTFYASSRKSESNATVDLLHSRFGDPHPPGDNC
jgi:hypothetical protein